MKKLVLFFSMLFLTSLAFCQTESKEVYQDNGVKVVTQKGVQKQTTDADNVRSTKPARRTLKDWTSDECQNAINDIEAKISFLRAHNASEEEIENYTKQLIPIRARLEELKSIR